MFPNNQTQGNTDWNHPLVLQLFSLCVCYKNVKCSRVVCVHTCLYLTMFNTILLIPQILSSSNLAQPNDSSCIAGSFSYVIRHFHSCFKIHSLQGKRMTRSSLHIALYVHDCLCLHGACICVCTRILYSINTGLSVSLYPNLNEIL